MGAPRTVGRLVTQGRAIGGGGQQAVGVLGRGGGNGRLERLVQATEDGEKHLGRVVHLLLPGGQIEGLSSKSVAKECLRAVGGCPRGHLLLTGVNGQKCLCKPV